MLANAAPSRLYLDLLNYASAARNSRASPSLHAKNRAFEVTSAVAVQLQTPGHASRRGFPNRLWESSYSIRRVWLMVAASLLRKNALLRRH